MIIAISGKIGSGKDTVGKIIQYLDDIAYPAISTITKRNWKIVKYADALKDIVCILTGCTREQLEDNTFKNIELGKEWDKYLLEEYWINDEFAEYTTKIYFNSREEMEKYCIEMNHTDSTCRQVSTIQKMTPRLLLQLLGTECGRNIIHPNIWVNALFSSYIPNGVPYNSLGDLFDDLKHCPSETQYPNWIITDCRFPNEAKAIKDKGGILIRVNRPCEECGVLEGHKMIPHKNKPSEHESETALDDYTEFDYVIENDGSIEELTEKVREILIKERII